MRISDWSSDVCSSDLGADGRQVAVLDVPQDVLGRLDRALAGDTAQLGAVHALAVRHAEHLAHPAVDDPGLRVQQRSDERRVGKECVRTCRARWAPYNEKHKKIYTKSEH